MEDVLDNIFSDIEDSFSLYGDLLELFHTRIPNVDFHIISRIHEEIPIQNDFTIEKKTRLAILEKMEQEDNIVTLDIGTDKFFGLPLPKLNGVLVYKPDIARI